MHDGCYSASVLQYVNNKKEIEIKNAAAKSGKDKADAKQLEKCVKGPQISTKPLDLCYPKIPPKPKRAMPASIGTKCQKILCKGGSNQRPKEEKVSFSHDSCRV